MATAAVTPARRGNISRRKAMWFYILISPWIIGFLADGSRHAVPG